jgi:hypothetical protein
MASELQIEANRKNAKKSRGPKSAAGKMKASRNALRHGLARVQDVEAPALDSLVSSISSYLGDLATAAAVEVARAKADLIRVREVRIGMLAELLQSPGELAVKRLLGLDRYERAALAKQKRALRSM